MAASRLYSKPRPKPLAALPVEFERIVSAKLRQMKQREVATDRPSRGTLVELDLMSSAAASRHLCHWGLHCACAPPRTSKLNPKTPTLWLLAPVRLKL